MRLSPVERKILNCIQEDIPLTSEPFKLISERAGLSEGEFLKRVGRLKSRGIIRNFAAGINHKKLGFISSLIAIKAPLDDVQTIAKKLIAYPEITHCFLRKGEYNLWIVFICLKKDTLKNFLTRLTHEVGKENILNLPTKRQFKLKTKIKI